MNNSSFIFPGQGSQSLGMLSDISSNFKEIQETFDLASEILGYDLWELTQKGPIEKLNQTQYTQPAILTASIGISKILENNGIIPKVVAGHSLGEFSSLVYSKTLDLTEGVDLVSYRGLIMQEAVPEGVGSMAAIIGLNSTKINDLCLSIENGTKVAIANYNSTGQTVISGYKEGILKAIELCKEAGAKKAVILPVSIPSHSFLLKDASLKLKIKMDTLKFKNPNIEIIHNVNAASTNSIEEMKDLLIKQMHQSVLWTQVIDNIYNKDIKTFIEVGPGKVLSGLLKRVKEDIKIYSTNNIDSLEQTLQNLSK